MAAARAGSPAFHPEAAMQVLEAPPGVLSVERMAPDGRPARVTVNLSGTPAAGLAPYEVSWVVT